MLLLLLLSSMTTVTVGVTASITHFATEQLWYIKPLPKPVIPEKRVVLAPASFLASLPPNSPHIHAAKWRPYCLLKFWHTPLII